MSDALENVTEKATAKLGPLPAWAWGLIIAAVALVAYFVFGSRVTGSSSTGGVTAAIADPESTDVAGLDSGSSTGSSSNATDSNQSWLSRAMAQVSAKLGASPSDVYAALSEGLQGGTVTTKGKTFWDTALSDLGAPPEGVQGAITVSDQVSSAAGSTLDDFLSRQQAIQDQWQAQQQAAQEAQQQAADQRAQQLQQQQEQWQAQQQATAEASRAAAEAAQAAAEQAAASSQPVAQTPAPTKSYSITSIPIGQTYTLQQPHKGYGSAADANVADTKKAKTTVNPGAYKVNGRQTLSKGVVVKLGNYWINV